MAALSRALPPVRGKVPLSLRLMRRLERHGGLAGTWDLRLNDGTRVVLPFQSLQSWWAAFQGSYDEAVFEHVRRYVQPGTLILDVGASLGLWTVPLGNAAAACGSKVWAFEPNPANFAWIRRNVEANGLGSTVTVRATGLGDEPGHVTLVSAEYGVGNGAIALREREATEKYPRIDIELERLDDVPLPGRISFIKIDTEGYECAFLRGAAGVIERDRPVIFGEFSTGWIKRRGEDLRVTLQAFDYTVRVLTQRSSRRWRSKDQIVESTVDMSSDEELPSNLLLLPR